MPRASLLDEVLTLLALDDDEAAFEIVLETCRQVDNMTLEILLDLTPVAEAEPDPRATIWRLWSLFAISLVTLAHPRATFPSYPVGLFLCLRDLLNDLDGVPGRVATRGEVDSLLRLNRINWFNTGSLYVLARDLPPGKAKDRALRATANQYDSLKRRLQL